MTAFYTKILDSVFLTNINNCTNKSDVKLSPVIAAGTFDNGIAKYVFECFQKLSSQKV